MGQYYRRRQTHAKGGKDLGNRRIHHRSDVKSFVCGKSIRHDLSTRFNRLERFIHTMAKQMEITRISEYALLLNRPWKLLWLNLIAGLSRGIGIAMGFTFFAATIIYVLQLLGALNLPIVGDYIADIVRIVQRQLELSTY